MELQTSTPAYNLTTGSLSLDGSLKFTTRSMTSALEISTVNEAVLTKIGALAPWSVDERDALWSLANYYSFNWSLIAFSIKSMRLGAAAGRNAQECEEKYSEMKNLDFIPTSKGEFLFFLPCRTGKATMSDTKMKALRLLHTFELIKQSAKKREAQRVPCS